MKYWFALSFVFALAAPAFPMQGQNSGTGAPLGSIACRTNATQAALLALSKVGGADAGGEFQSAMLKRESMEIRYESLDGTPGYRDSVAVYFSTKEDGFAEFIVKMNSQCNVVSTNLEDVDH